MGSFSEQSLNEKVQGSSGAIPLRGEEKISEIFEGYKSNPNVVQQLITSSSSSLAESKATIPHSSFSDSKVGKVSKKVSWGANPEPVIIPNKEDLKDEQLWWKDLPSRGFDKMLARNNERELREFSNSMFFWGDSISKENQKKFTYEALTSPTLVDQGYNSEEVVLDCDESLMF